MKLIGGCSEPDNNNGIVKVLVTIYTNGQPLYVWVNVLKEHIDFDWNKPVEVIIRNVEE